MMAKMKPRLDNKVLSYINYYEDLIVLAFLTISLLIGMVYGSAYLLSAIIVALSVQVVGMIPSFPYDGFSRYTALLFFTAIGIVIIF